MEKWRLSHKEICKENLITLLSKLDHFNLAEKITHNYKTVYFTKKQLVHFRLNLLPLFSKNSLLQPIHIPLPTVSVGFVFIFLFQSWKCNTMIRNKSFFNLSSLT
jgi:hypothetical protein